MINVFLSYETYNPMMLHNTKYHDLPFILEPDKFNIVDKVKYADVIPDMRWIDTPGLRMEDKINFLGPDFKDQWILRMMHTHVTETIPDAFNLHEKEPWLPYTKNIIVVDTNLKNTKEVTYNFLWNRQKAYFVDYDKFDLKYNRLWTRYASKKMYMLQPIPDFRLGVPSDMKKFLMPGRTTVESGAVRIRFRLRLKEVVKEVEDSFYSDWNPEAPMLLWPEERLHDTQKELFENFAGWWPIAN